jgi:hypothetical protein
MPVGSGLDRHPSARFPTVRRRARFSTGKLKSGKGFSPGRPNRPADRTFSEPRAERQLGGSHILHAARGWSPGPYLSPHPSTSQRVADGPPAARSRNCRRSSAIGRHHTTSTRCSRPETQAGSTNRRRTDAGPLRSSAIRVGSLAGAASEAAIHRARTTQSRHFQLAKAARRSCQGLDQASPGNFRARRSLPRNCFTSRNGHAASHL